MKAALVLFLASICLVASRHVYRDQYHAPNFGRDQVINFIDYIKDSIAIAGSLDSLTHYTKDGKVPAEVLREDVIDSLFDGEYPGPTSMKFKEIWNTDFSKSKKRTLLEKLFKKDEILLKKIGGYMGFVV